jgi:predicted phosphodiesterase
MPAGPLPRDLCEEAVEVLRNHQGNLTRAADTLGIARSTLQGRIKAAALRTVNERETNYTPDVPALDLGDVKPRVRVKAYNPLSVHELPVRKVLAIGDTHWQPGMNFDHMKWIGRFAAESRPDNVVHIGDALDLSSCEMHSVPGSASQARRPTFQEDIECGEDALFSYHSEIGVGELPHDIVFGNHEYRAWRKEELAPELEGTLTLQVEQLFGRYRWRTTPYKHWLFMEGVGMTHCVMNIMGKPIGGRYPENMIGNLSTHSTIWGHTHRFNHVVIPKVGVNNSITVTNVGSAMPYGYTADYTDGCITGLTYGVVMLRLRGGRVEGASLISMLELEEKYR